MLRHLLVTLSVTVSVVLVPETAAFSNHLSGCQQFDGSSAANSIDRRGTSGCDEIWTYGGRDNAWGGEGDDDIHMGDDADEAWGNNDGDNIFGGDNASDTAEPLHGMDGWDDLFDQGDLDFDFDILCGGEGKDELRTTDQDNLDFLRGGPHPPGDADVLVGDSIEDATQASQDGEC